ncbi:hypothetical protein BT63DRAFT_412760 [Microthyrium microscopicum]|uniref:Uncharacterized protein n=1 Tax=Microthyrium microscopicum TaxID=703497 RepID=A0A6A6UCV0_9PEZI|nr:hypothetical protein BT63DRAFT_412760 [Microthyrium microscopicum]
MPGRRNSSSSAGLSSPIKVGFAPTLVTGVSRPLGRKEHWTIYYFEEHAAKCPDCQNPDEVQKQGFELCPEGFEKAADVADLLFKLRVDGEVHCISPREGQSIRIEIPPDYDNVISLLRAFRRSGRGLIEKRASFDRHYPVGPRLAPRGEVKEPKVPQPPSRSPSRSVSPAYNTQTYEPSSPTRRKSISRRPRQAPERSSRGSLQDFDERTQREADMRERLCQYDTEDRRPFYSRTRSVR